MTDEFDLEEFEERRNAYIAAFVEAVENMTDEELFAFANKFPEFDLAGVFSPPADPPSP